MGNIDEPGCVSRARSQSFALPMRPLKCFIAANSHGTYCVPAASKHRPAVKAILGGEVWEAETLGFLSAHCHGGDVIHAGTYFGDFLPALSRAVDPGAKIWAFEPSSESFRCAGITMKLNDVGNVVLTHAALGARAGEALLCTGLPNGRVAGGGSEIVGRKEYGLSYETVRVVAIDEVVPANRHISILQLDVEHFEQQALDGGLATIRRSRPLLVLENLPTDEMWFEANILSLGYEEIGQFDKNRAFRAESQQT